MSKRIVAAHCPEYPEDYHDYPEYEDLSELQPPTPEPVQPPTSRKRTLMWDDGARPSKVLRLDVRFPQPLTDGEITFAEIWAREIRQQEDEAIQRIRALHREALVADDSSCYSNSTGEESGFSQALSEISNASESEQGGSSESEEEEEETDEEESETDEEEADDPDLSDLISVIPLEEALELGYVFEEDDISGWSPREAENSEPIGDQARAQESDENPLPDSTSGDNYEFLS